MSLLDTATNWFENELTYDAFRDKSNEELAASLLATITALLPDCPTCGGTGEIVAMQSGQAVDAWPCPAGCVDGKVTVAQMAALWQAVHEFEFRELQWGDEYDAGAQAAIEQVREAAKAVRP